MKTNQVMLRPMGGFTIEVIANNLFFNATALLDLWNFALGTEYSVEVFVEQYIPEAVRDQAVKKINDSTYLSIMLEPQLRLHAANCDIELYDKLNADVIAWVLPPSITYPSEAACKAVSRQTYLMIDEASGLIKIGRSRDPQFREHTLGAQIPRIKLIAVCADDVESVLHEKYKSKRVRGEWFNLSDRDVNSIIKQFNFKRHEHYCISSKRARLS